MHAMKKIGRVYVLKAIEGKSVGHIDRWRQCVLCPNASVTGDIYLKAVAVFRKRGVIQDPDTVFSQDKIARQSSCRQIHKGCDSTFQRVRTDPGDTVGQGQEQRLLRSFTEDAFNHNLPVSGCQINRLHATGQCRQKQKQIFAV